MTVMTDTRAAHAFPGLRTPDGARWHYLDSAATAQKPDVVIDAVARALGPDYATVHRGLYARSADMTLAYEAARRTVAALIGGAEHELVFTRGATEAINLVAQSWGVANLRPGDRILLSMLEHHSNIVPWQLIRERTGVAIDVCPLTEDGLIDLDAAERMLTPAHKLVSFAHVSNVLGSMLDVPRAVALAHGVGAKILIDGCQSVARLPVDVAALGCDFFVFSAHKLYGPTGIGALWARADLVVVLDLPRRTVMRQVVLRTVRRGVVRRELWNGNRESWRNALSRDPLRNIILWSWNTHSKYHVVVPVEARASVGPERVTVLTSVRGVRKYLDAAAAAR